MKVLFFSPAYPPEMVEFTKALVALGVQVIGVVDATPSKSVRHLLSGIVHVPSLLDEERAYSICVDWLKTHTVDQIISNWEPTMLLAARLRASLVSLECLWTQPWPFEIKHSCASEWLKRD